MAKQLSSEEIERIGFHKGSLATLSKEREELSKMVNIVEQLMRMHIEELKNLGVDLAAAAQASGGADTSGSSAKKPVKKVKGKQDLSSML